MNENGEWVLKRKKRKHDLISGSWRSECVGGASCVRKCRWVGATKRALLCHMMSAKASVQGTTCVCSELSAVFHDRSAYIAGYSPFLYPPGFLILLLSNCSLWCCFDAVQASWHLSLLCSVPHRCSTHWALSFSLRAHTHIHNNDKCQDACTASKQHHNEQLESNKIRNPGG
jgi:hypothetical protein